MGGPRSFQNVVSAIYSPFKQYRPGYDMKKIKVLSSKVHGRGIFAEENIKKGERIQYIKGKKIRLLSRSGGGARPMPNWFGISKSIWLDPGKGLFRYLNHSCAPNSAIVGTKTLVALKNIEKGKEVFIDYSLTDSDPNPNWYMLCRCDAKNCRKLIRAIYTVPRNVFEKHMPYVPKYFQRLYYRENIYARANSGHNKRKRRDVR